MKEFKGVFDTLQDIYEAFQNGSESGRFATANGLFYEWKQESWLPVNYLDITTWEIPIGEWRSVNIANPPEGLSVDTYYIISFKNMLNVVTTYALSDKLYLIKDNVATIVENPERTYVENEATQPTASEISKIPLLRYQLAPVENLEELYLKYPNGGERGWYAMLTDLNVFGYWEDATNEWKAMASDPVQADWATKAGAEAGVNNSTIMTPLRTIESIRYNVPTVYSQELAPTAAKLNDIWISTNTLIEYRWLGAWVNLNLQTTDKYVDEIISDLIDGGLSNSTPTLLLDGGFSNSMSSELINGGTA